MTTANRQLKRNPIAVLADNARSANPVHAHYVPGFDTPRMIETPAVAVGTLDLLRDLSLPADVAYALGIVTPPVDNSHAFDLPRPEIIPAGRTTNVNPLRVITDNSVVARAGAHVLVAELPTTEMRSGVPVFFKRTEMFRNADPSVFVEVADGAAAAESALPLHTATWSWDTAPGYGFSCVITREQRKAVGGDQLEDIALVAIMRGIGLLADQLLLQSIVAATPAAFTFGAAAARFAKQAELRAVVGSAGAGAEIAGDGSFRCAGVFAELTGATDKSIVGLFNRAAVAVRPEIQIRALRNNAAGDTTISVWVNALPVLPNAADFWSVT